MANVTDNAWTSVLNVFRDVVYIDIQNVISLENTYCFNSRMGFNHPELAKMLCPVKYLVDYLKVPAE
jgi:hypothetical protein